MSKGHRTERVGEEIKKIISEMLLKDIKDPRLTERLISITAVDVSPDHIILCFTDTEKSKADTRAKRATSCSLSL